VKLLKPFWPTKQKRPTKSCKPMKRWLTLLLLTLALSPLTNSALAQKPTASSANEQEVARLRKALGEALDRLTDLEKQQAAANAAIEAIKQERLAAQAEREAAQRERESLERSVKYAGDAIAAQQKVIDTYEKLLVPALEKLVDRHEKRIDKLEDRLDKANSRTAKAGVGGFLLGVLVKLVKPF
jgi:chromosome segregation ATPase